MQFSLPKNSTYIHDQYPHNAKISNFFEKLILQKKKHSLAIHHDAKFAVISLKSDKMRPKTSINFSQSEFDEEVKLPNSLATSGERGLEGRVWRQRTVETMVGEEKNGEPISH